MIKIKLRPELVPIINDWSPDFDPLTYTWYVEMEDGMIIQNLSI